MAHLTISDLSIAETLDRKAVTSVKGGWSPELYGPRYLYPIFPSSRTQNQNIAVNAVQLANNQGFGSITQNMAIGVSANQA